MKTINFLNTLHYGSGKRVLLYASMIIALLVSCNNDDTTADFSATDNESAALDAKDDYYFDDTDDMVTEALAESDAELSGGRTTTDARFACAVITWTGTREYAILKIDFGDGCVGPRGNLRKGVIIVERTGVWNEPGTYWVTNFFDYSVNGIGIDGTRTVTLVSVTDALVTYDVILEDGKITWPDGRVGTREAKHRREHERHENHLLDRIIIYGTAQGTLCNGRKFYIEIIEPLIYDRACAAEGVFIPVQGVKFIKHGNRELTIDYGDGTCDNIVTLTFKDGRPVRYEVKK